MQRLASVLTACLYSACGGKTTERAATPTTPTPPVAVATGPSSNAAPAPASPAVVSPASAQGTASTATGAVTPVLLVMGGYTSCGDNGDPQQQEMQAIFQTLNKAMTATAKTAPHYLLSCYTADNSQVSYMLSTAGAAPSAGPVAGMISSLQAMLATLSNPVLYLVGHSYGGWTALTTVQTFDAKYKVGGLITLDPISMANCTPINFVVANFGSGADPGCLTAPTDFSPLALQGIASRVGFWSNYYETADAVLHSGPMSQATTNTLEAYASGGFVGHNAFTSDNALMAQMSQTITTSLAALLK